MATGIPLPPVGRWSRYLLAFTVVTPFLLAGWIAIQWRQHEISDANAAALLLARHFASSYEREVRRTRDTLLDLARSAGSVEAAADLSTLVAGAPRQRPYWKMFGTFTPPARFVFAGGAQGPLNGAAKAVVRRAFETGQFVAGDREFDSDAKEMTVTFAARASQSDGAGSVAFALISLAWLQQLAAEEALLPPGAAVTVFDVQGTIVARWPEPARWVGQSVPEDLAASVAPAAGREGTLEARLRDRGTHLVAYVPLRGVDDQTDLYLSVDISSTAATGEADRLLLQYVAVFGVPLVLSFLAGGMAIRSHEVRTRESQRIGALLDVACEGVALFDKEGRFQFVSTSAAELFGSPGSALVGQPLITFVHADDRDNVAMKFASVSNRAHGCGVVTFRGWMSGASRGRLQCEFRNLLDDSNVRAVVATFLDVTDKPALSPKHWLARDTLSRVIEQTADSVLIANRDGIIEYVNPAFEAMTGFTREEAIGQTPRLLKSGVQSALFYQKLWGTILAGHPFRATLTNRRKDGALFEEDLAISPIRDSSGTITHFVSTARDLTQRKRTLEALRRLTAQLEDQAGRFAGILHDEAGPLLTAAHLTLADVIRDADSAAHNRLQRVRWHLDQLEERLRHIAHEIHPRVVADLGLQGAVSWFTEGFARRTGIAVDVQSSLPKRYKPAVETVLYRIVQEGLTNASRHARAKRIVVTLSADDATVSCSIRDDGVGFRAAFGESEGLGLQLMQDRLEAIGGTLAVISEPGSGTELRASAPAEV